MTGTERVGAILGLQVRTGRGTLAALYGTRLHRTPPYPGRALSTAKQPDPPGLGGTTCPWTWHLLRGGSILPQFSVSAAHNILCDGLSDTNPWRTCPPGAPIARFRRFFDGRPANPATRGRPRPNVTSELARTARALRQEGLSQAQIGRELGVPRRTVSRWVNGERGQDRAVKMANVGEDGQNDLSARRPPRYLVVQGAAEKFRPPDGVAFALVEWPVPEHRELPSCGFCRNNPWQMIDFHK